MIVNKTILIISPEPWGVNRLSKHHYASHLARMGNSVFFIPPPQKGKARTDIELIEDNLHQINYSPLLRGSNRLPRAFRTWFQKRDAHKIRQAIKTPIDIVWSFDPYRFQSLNHFDGTISIFHPVDYFSTSLKFEVARSADFLFSVSEEILKEFTVPNKLLVNHGLADVFLNQESSTKKDSIVRCGYVGNLLSFGLDHECLLEIITQNPQVEFNMIGPFDQSNLGGRLQDLKQNLDDLKRCTNVVFHGPLSSSQVATTIQGFDMFLICYSERISKIASNSHKLLEYLSTGKVIVSSMISSYQKTNNLLEMVGSNKDMPGRFQQIVGNLSHYNGAELENIRKSFARANSYSRQIQRIEEFIMQRGSKI